MSGFVKYQHVERWGNVEVEGIEVGECWVFPKLDGTNSSIWFADGKLCAGSRNRELSLESDNHGFLAWAVQQDGLIMLALDHPNLVFYGEWLVPHTLKTYRKDAWRRFWIFDVWDREKERYLSFDEYQPIVHKWHDDIIYPLCKITNGSEEQFRKQVESNTFLLEDGAGAGEGVVIKNYLFTNKFGNINWAKIVRNEFKEDNKRQFGVNEVTGERMREVEFAERFVTPAFLEKERAKIETSMMEEDGEISRKKLIPRLLGTCYHTLLREEIPSFIIKNKNPTIDFKRLNRYVIHQVKKLSPDLF